MDHSKCGPLFEASKALLGKSGLVRWNDQTGMFAPKYPSNNDSEFEKCCKARFHQDYGRYIAWVLFSVGAENLVKAACECNGVVQRGQPIPWKYPRFMASIPVTDWVDMVMDDKCSDSGLIRATKVDYQTLGDYWKSHIRGLCKLREICLEETRHLIASYKYLTQVIRNRDAHTYIEDERRRDFPAVKPIFVPAFNILVETMKKNQHFDS